MSNTINDMIQNIDCYECVLGHGGDGGQWIKSMADNNDTERPKQGTNNLLGTPSAIDLRFTTRLLTETRRGNSQVRDNSHRPCHLVFVSSMTLTLEGEGTEHVDSREFWRTSGVFAGVDPNNIKGNMPVIIEESDLTQEDGGLKPPA